MRQAEHPTQAEPHVQNRHRAPGRLLFWSRRLGLAIALLGAGFLLGRGRSTGSPDDLAVPRVQLALDGDGDGDGDGDEKGEGDGDGKGESEHAPVRLPPKDPLGQVPAALRAGLAATQAGPGSYSVQVGAFTSPAEARAAAAQLSRRGLRPFLVLTPGRQTPSWYRVRLGEFTDETAAMAAKRWLATADIPAWVVRVDA